MAIGCRRYAAIHPEFCPIICWAIHSRVVPDTASPPEPTDFPVLVPCPQFPQAAHTISSVHKSVINHPLTESGAIALMVSTLQRRRGARVRKSGPFNQKRAFCDHASRWMNRQPQGGFCARFSDGRSSQGTGVKKLLILYLVFAAMLSTRYRVPRERVSRTE